MWKLEGKMLATPVTCPASMAIQYDAAAAKALGHFCLALSIWRVWKLPGPVA